MTAITDRNDWTSTFVYDRMNRILSGKDPLGNTLTYTYDAAGNKLTETDAEGYVTAYGYDAMGRMVEVRGPVKEAMEDREAAGNPAKEAENGDSNGSGQKTAVNTNAEAPATRYTYDGADRLLTVTDRGCDRLHLRSCHRRVFNRDRRPGERDFL